MIVNKKEGIPLEIIKNLQTSWTESFNAIADDQQKNGDLTQISNDFDKQEWEW